MHSLHEEWTANVVGRMHRYGIKNDELAKRCGFTPQYLSMVLNCKKKLTAEGKTNVKRIIFGNLQELELEVSRERLHN